MLLIFIYLNIFKFFEYIINFFFLFIYLNFYLVFDIFLYFNYFCILCDIIIKLSKYLCTLKISKSNAINAYFAIITNVVIKKNVSNF